MKCYVVVVAALLAACGDSAGPGEDAIPAELAAEWYTGATCYPQCGLTLVPVADAADSINFTLASSTSLRLTRGGAYTMRITGAGDTTITGSARAENGYLVLLDRTGTDTADYVLEGDYLTLRWRRAFRVNDPGSSYDARLRGRFRRRG